MPAPIVKVGAGFFRAPGRAHACGCTSRRTLITANAAQRKCVRAIEPRACPRGRATYGDKCRFCCRSVAGHCAPFTCAHSMDCAGACLCGGCMRVGKCSVPGHPGGLSAVRGSALAQEEFGQVSIDQVLYHLRFGSEGVLTSDPEIIHRFLWRGLALPLALAVLLWGLDAWVRHLRVHPEAWPRPWLRAVWQGVLAVLRHAATHPAADRAAGRARRRRRLLRR